jgi:ketosteroid isomerase-like protein
MSQENVDLTLENFARFQAGDSTWENYIHPEIEWDFSAYPLADIPSRGRGREEVLTEVIATYYSGWRGYEAQISEIIDAGDDVVVIQHEVVRVGDSDAPLERDTFHVWTIRDRKWVGWRIYPDRESALEAVGLRR